LEEWVVNNWDKMNEVEEYLKYEGKEWDWVWVDSMSLLQEFGLDHIWEDTITRRPDRARYGPDKPEYGINMDRLSRWLRNVVSLDSFNFGFTAHPMTTVILGRDVLMPRIQGKDMANKFCGYMNIVAYYEVAAIKRGGSTTRERVLRFTETEEYFAKDQWDAVPNGRMISPTMPRIIEAIDAKRPKPQGAVRKSSIASKRAAARRRARSKQKG
jgi:hypothetical protein